jgi:RimJ/RimL family protein N-acetyltransferase
VPRPLRVRALQPRDREAALAHLERASRLNLLLVDLVLRLGRPAQRGEPQPELVAALRDAELAGIVALAPNVLLDASADREALEALFPYLSGVGSGLVKSTEDAVGPLWEWLERRGRRALLDRIEVAYALEAPDAREAPLPPHARVRPAERRDLDALVEAARASLREENRPDAFPDDPVGFRRWVESRLGRARVVELGRRVVFVGYADVQCPRGWLLQGVYTWPLWRRRGLAAAGVSALCRAAFDAGADHVQLAVVEGNRAATALYERLGFRRFARLRTLLFA